MIKNPEGHGTKIGNNEQTKKTQEDAIFVVILIRKVTRCRLPVLGSTVGCVDCKLKFPTRRTSRNMLREWITNHYH